MGSWVGSHAVCTWFPEHGAELIAADDLDAFAALAPAGKIFTCVGSDGPWLLVKYGDASFRASPEVFAKVATPAFALGQRVKAGVAFGEVSHLGWHFRDEAPIYLLSFGGEQASRRYTEAELTAVQAPAPKPPRLILASASPARQQTLLDAGLSPEIVVSKVDEDAFTAPDVIGLVATLAKAKARAVFTGLDSAEDLLVVACDSLLELDGQPMGKPASAAQAVERWRQMRGRTGRLHTGHHVVSQIGGVEDAVAAVATTEVVFANIDDTEISAYVATGEPLRVAGAFTIDGLGGAYVTTVCGDPHNVVGISLPLLRRMFAEVGVPWHTLWQV